MKRLLLIPLILMLFGCASNQTYNENSAASQGEIDLEIGKYDNSPAKTFIGLAAAYIQRNDFETALRYADRAIKEDPQNPNSFNVMAIVLQQIGQVNKADENFRKALSISPYEPYINSAYASFLCERKDFDRAKIHFTNSINHPLFTKKYLPMAEIGICALRNERLDLAEEYLRKALQINGKFAPALYNMIDVSVRTENYWSARAYIQRYLEVARHDAKTLYWGIKTEQQLGDKNNLDSYKLLLKNKFPDSKETALLQQDGSL